VTVIAIISTETTARVGLGIMGIRIMKRIWEIDYSLAANVRRSAAFLSSGVIIDRKLLRRSSDSVAKPGAGA
jgi:hypothetical protein